MKSLVIFVMFISIERPVFITVYYFSIICFQTVSQMYIYSMLAW